jgi:hypothetical protein
MPKRTLHSVLAVVAILPAAASLTTGLSPGARAADECLAKPNAVAPQGRHWYYRLERPTQRHCWYLGPDGAKVGRAASPQRPPLGRPAAQPIAETPTETPPSASVPVPAQTLSTRWGDLPKSTGSNVAEWALPSDSYADEQPAADMASQDDMPLVWPVLTPAEQPTIEQPRAWAGESEHTVAFVVCALALAATIAFTIFKLGAARRPRRRHLRDRWDSASSPAHRPLRTREPPPASGPRRDQGLPRFLLERTAA